MDDNAASPSPIEFWGDLAPIEKPIVWKGVWRRIGYHILTNEEDIDIIRRVNLFPKEEQLMREGELRAAYAVDYVDGKEVRMGVKSEEGIIRSPSGCLHPVEMIARANWVHTWQGPLLDTILIHYDKASQEPLVYLSEMIDDPNIEPGRSLSGEPTPPADPGSSPGSSPPECGPSASSTPAPTKSKRRKNESSGIESSSPSSS